MTKHSGTEMFMIFTWYGKIHDRHSLAWPIANRVKSHMSTIHVTLDKSELSAKPSSILSIHTYVRLIHLENDTSIFRQPCRLFQYYNFLGSTPKRPLTNSYEPNCIAPLNTDRATRGVVPLKRAPEPSSRAIVVRAPAIPPAFTFEGRTTRKGQAGAIKRVRRTSLTCICTCYIPGHPSKGKNTKSSGGYRNTLDRALGPDPLYGFMVKTRVLIHYRNLDRFMFLFVDK